MNKIHIIIKVTNGCNLRCKYCYNSDSRYTTDVLPLESFERLIRLASAGRDAIDLIWHGGEPLSVGIDYYRKAVEIEEKVFGEYRVEINNSIQTNGTLIDGEWVKFFKKYRFRVGVSFDGLNNGAYRQQTDKVLAAMQLLKNNDIKFGCLAVVADESFDMLENYKFFSERSIPIRFSPMFAEGGGSACPGVSAQYFVRETNRLFDYWLTDKQGVDIREFRSYISLSLGGGERICTNGSCHGSWLGIDAKGELYNCGRDSIKDYGFGNINDLENLDDAYRSDGFRRLIAGSVIRRKKCMATCELFKYCQGGCPDTAIIDRGLEEIPEFSCACFKGIFTHVYEAVERIKADGTPLDELNPAVKQAAIKCLAYSEYEGHTENK